MSALATKPVKSLLVRGYEVVIGLETHAQLSTQSRSSAVLPRRSVPNPTPKPAPWIWPARNPAGDEPRRVERAIEFGLAVVRAHRAAQHLCPQELLLPGPAQGLPDQPVRDPGGSGRRGGLYLGDERRTVRLVRAHPRRTRESLARRLPIGQSGIDLNRAGTPLLEIVTEPDIRSSAEAVACAGNCTRS